MTNPARLTPEDLPTLRLIEAFLREREQRMARPWRGPLHRLPHRYLVRLLWQVMRLDAQRAIAAIERTGNLASDERVDKDGRVSRL